LLQRLPNVVYPTRPTPEPESPDLFRLNGIGQGGELIVGAIIQVHGQIEEDGFNRSLWHVVPSTRGSASAQDRTRGLAPVRVLLKIQENQRPLSIETPG
jgi:hypothetical protein